MFCPNKDRWYLWGGGDGVEVAGLGRVDVVVVDVEEMC